MTQRFCSFLPPSLVVATCVALASSLVHAQERESSTVLVVLPEARHDAMIAALRVELAGHAGVLEGACPSEGCTLTSLRVAAEAQGADQVVWVTFPQGEIAPAEVRVLRIASTRSREAMLPSAWDVIEPRVMAAVTASLVESEEPTEVADPPPRAPAPTPQITATEAITSPPTEASVEAPTEDTETPEESDAPGPFTIQIGFGYGHRHAPDHPPGADVQMTGVPLTLAFYGQLTDWAAVGVRLRGALGYSSIEGVGGSGLIGVPSLMLTLHEQLTPTLGIRWGTHVEGGLNFYGSNFDTWSFGLGVGVYMTLEVGPTMGFQIDYDINMYGFGERGAFFDGMGMLNYVGRFE